MGLTLPLSHPLNSEYEAHVVYEVGCLQSQYEHGGLPIL